VPSEVFCILENNFVKQSPRGRPSLQKGSPLWIGAAVAAHLTPLLGLGLYCPAFALVLKNGRELRAVGED